MSVRISFRFRSPFFWGCLVLLLWTLTTGLEVRAEHLLDDAAADLTDADFAADRIANLVQELHAEDLQQRNHAAVNLSRIGAEARAAVPILLEQLQLPAELGELSAREELLLQSQQALVSIGSEAVPALTRNWSNEIDRRQQQLISVAHQIGPPARELLPRLVELVDASDADDRELLLEAVVAIDQTGKTALSVLIAALQHDPSPEVRALAALRLNRRDFSDQMDEWMVRPVPICFESSPLNCEAAGAALVAALEDPDFSVCENAALSLPGYPEVIETSVPALLQLVKSPRQELRHTIGGFEVEIALNSVASQALSRMDVTMDDVLPVVLRELGPANLSGMDDLYMARLAEHCRDPLSHLLPVLKSDHPQRAFVALARLGAGGRAALPVLERLADQSGAKFAPAAHWTLACLDAPGHPKSVERLRQAILDTTEDYEMCRFLHGVGPRAAVAVPFLEERLDQEIPFDMDQTATVLNAIGPPAAACARHLIPQLGRESGIEARRLEDALVALGPKTALLLLQQLQDHKTLPVERISCLRVLSRIRPAVAQAVSEIIRQLNSPHPRVREAAVMALGDIMARPEESLPALQRMLSDPRPFVRAAAARSVARFGQDAVPYVSDLITALSDDYLDVRVAAAAGLGHLGQHAAAAQPALKKLRDTESFLFRETVREALLAITAVPAR